MSFFGRTYLLSTFKIPPLPPAGKASAGAGNPVHGERGRIRVGEGAAAASAGAAGGTAAQSAEEERRAFEWMGRALQGKGKEAAGGAGIFPSAGSPVVLDLGAVSQVCAGSFFVSRATAATPPPPLPGGIRFRIAR